MFPTTSAVAIHSPIERFNRGLDGLDGVRRSAAGFATAMTNPFLVSASQHRLVPVDLLPQKRR
jgi:hypothetical protein